MFKLFSLILIPIFIGIFPMKVAHADEVMKCGGYYYKMDRHFLKKPTFSRRIKGEWVNVETLIFRELECKEADRTYKKKFCKRTKTSVHCEYEYSCKWSVPEPEPVKIGIEKTYKSYLEELQASSRFTLSEQIKNYESLKSGSWTLDFEIKRQSFNSCKKQ